MPRTVNLFSSAVNGFLAYLGLWELQAYPGPSPGEKEQPELSRKEYLRLLAAAGALGKRRAYMLVKAFAATRTAVQGTSPADGGGCEKRGGPSAETNIAALSLPANGAAALRPGHRGARGAGIRHPAGQA